MLRLRVGRGMRCWRGNSGLKETWRGGLSVWIPWVASARTFLQGSR